MKILHVNDVAGVGYTLVAELVRLGVNAVLLVPETGGLATLRSSRSDERFIVRVSGRCGKRGYGIVLRLFKSRSWDLVHVHYLRAYAYAVSLLRMPYLIHAHGSDVRLAFSRGLYEGVIHRMLKKYVLKRSLKTLASTPNLVPLIKLLSPETEVSYMPNPVDMKLFSQENARRLSKTFTHLHDGVDLLIFAPSSVNFHVKGNDLLLKALSAMNPTATYRLIIVRHGQDLHRLLQLAEKLKLRERIRAIDPVPNELMPGLYGASDIVIGAISKRRVLSMTALESMACKVPTINTWSKEYYGDTGFPALRYGVEPLKAYLNELLENRVMRTKIANAQFKWVRRNHDSRMIAKKLIEIYEELIL